MAKTARSSALDKEVEALCLVEFGPLANRGELAETTHARVIGRHAFNVPHLF